MLQRRLLSFGCVALATVVVLGPASSSAQSAQPWSGQASLLLANVDLGGSLVGGAGIEAQLRYTPASLFSLGVGLQSTAHSSGNDKLTLAGMFAEPRFAIDIGSDRFAPYVAGRVALLRQTSDLRSVDALDAQSSGFGIGGGGGFLIRASRTVNFDVGVAFVNQSFSDAVVKAGSRQGSTVSFDSFFGYVVKGGVSVGFGSK